MKKIAFVIESLSLGGAEKSLVTLLQNIDFDKFSVTLYLFKKNGIFEEFVPKQVKINYLEIPEINVFERIQFKVLKYISSNLHSAQIFWKIIANKFYFIQDKFDVAIAYNQGLVTYFVSRYIQADSKYAWINTDYKKAGYKIDFDLAYYQEFKKVIAVSPAVKKVFQNELLEKKVNFDIEIIKDITDKKILAIQSESFIPKEFKKNKINIVTVARLSKHKALHLAIDACRILIAKGYDINWFVLGEGNERKVLEKQIVYSKLEHCFFLLGAKTNPYPYIKACDVYVQTSRLEGLGLSVIEASYLFKPIVCTNFPSVYNILKENQTGLVCDMNATDIVQKIEKLLTNKELSDKLIANLKVQNNNDKEISLHQFYQLLE